MADEFRKRQLADVIEEWWRDGANPPEIRREVERILALIPQWEEDEEVWANVG